MTRIGIPLKLTVDQVRARWRAASVRGGWMYAEDWWVPAVDALAEALAEGGDGIPALEQLGRQRAEAGVDVAETLGDIYALFAAIRLGAVPLFVVRALALGWTEVACQPGESCTDPLTSLTTVAYLRTRLAEVYQAAREDRQVCASHALVVVALERPANRAISWWERLSRMMLVAESLRHTFRAGQTLCVAGSTVAVALTERDSALPVRVAVLRELVERQIASLSDQAGARVWVERLPLRLADALALLEEFRR